MIADLLRERQILTRPMPRRPNQFSVVLWLRVGDLRILLGADMEEQHNPYGGWRIIVESAERPEGEASLIKVPHHGSKTGQCESVWAKMLLRNPVALLTPFHSGRTRLPTEEDARRIGRMTSNAFISAPLRDRSSRGRTGGVNRTIHETVRYITRANDGFGHIRARRKIVSETGGWSVVTFGDAIPLSSLYR